MIKKITFMVFLFGINGTSFGKSELVSIESDDISATTQDITLLDVVPAGVIMKLKVFGCAIPTQQRPGGGSPFETSDTKLEWGSGSTFQLIRVCLENNQFTINRDFVGDGVKRLRVVRDNKSPTVKNMTYWVEALIKD
jgi:hypothetical protein